MITVALIVVGVGIATSFALQAFRKNLLYFYSPSQVMSGEAPSSRTFRIGGMVEKGSVKREPGSLERALPQGQHNVASIKSTLTPSLPPRSA